MSNPWSDFESNIPERGFLPASTGARDPEADTLTPQEPTTVQDSGHAAGIVEPSQPDWGLPADSDDIGIPGVSLSSQPAAPKSRGHVLLVSAIAVGALGICAVATIAGANLISSMGTSKTETATVEPTETVTPPPPKLPASSLSRDVKSDLAFTADIPASGASLKNVSVVLDSSPDWVREDSPGFTSYRNVNGCTVNWSQKEHSFPAGVTDFEASHDALFEVTQDRNFMVTEYGYWTSDSTDRAGKTEVVESRVDRDGKAVVVAARATVATGEVGLIWMSCEDPSKLTRFSSSTRFDMGFIIDGLSL